MPTTMTKARDEMFKMLHTQLSTTTVQYQGINYSSKPSASTSWVHVSVLHDTGQQQTLAGGDGKRRYNRTGTIIVMCFGPLSNAGGFRVAQELAENTIKAYQGKAGAGGIWFRNCRAREIGPSEAWYQFNAYVEFVYDEIS